LNSETKITFVASSVSGSLVSDENPIVVQGSWLQVLIPNSFLDAMETSLKFLEEPTMVNVYTSSITIETIVHYF